MTRPNEYWLINTLPYNEQDCLIKNTIPYNQEEQKINELMSRYDIKDKPMIVYGKNANDESAEKKYKQLIQLGFRDVYIYSGGLFEWLLLQDIYSSDEFPTTTKVLDLLKYRPETGL
jgi:rhodanese-related sulfurtransferase